MTTSASLWGTKVPASRRRSSSAWASASSVDPDDRQVRGAGLGLAFAKEVLELQGSKLDVISTKHVGTQFSFTLPLPAAPAHLDREHA